MSEKEVWAILPSGRGLYEVSTEGRVRSIDRVGTKPNRWGGVCRHTFRGRVLKPWHDSNGYLVVYICGDGRREAINVHRLIAETFCEHIPGKDHVNHKDGNKYNNCPSNLEWCTRSENMQHAVSSGLLAVRPVEAISKDGAITLFFKSTHEAAKFIGISNRGGNIRCVLAGLRPVAYGFFWRYA